MKALVCLNGKAPGKRLLLRCARESDRVFCADGALHYLLKNGILPDAWLGDLDSVSPDDRAYAERAGLQATVFPVRKDFTDGQLVVRQAIREGADEILLLGAFGGRSDHFLANLRLLYDTVRAGVRITALSEREQIRVETGTVCFEARSGRLVSLLPFTDELTVQKTEGFLYGK